ncbi:MULTISPECIES: hypothetical protein [Achromobacter]|uniref:Uncharacterized protein n=1 Tax=Achromobacter piechaudii TaxID=72556 RepID=A0A6S7EB64_9BURK|nr:MULTISPECIES: hypothetical protein [Achromobacter]MPS78708.1 hypothetical protein [Achromobacter sp.]CAB3902632.1 hypothetical protein LMG1861_04377 [Achromobacter piechaudii]
MKSLIELRQRLVALRQGRAGSPLRWHWQCWAERLGRGGLLALVALIVLVLHCAFVLWPEKGELRMRSIELNAELHSCSPYMAPPGNDMDELRVQLRLDPDQRKLAVMEQLQKSGLLLIEIQYQGEDTIQGRLRRTSVDITAVGSYQDLSAGLRRLIDEPLLRLESLALDRQRPENMLVNVKMRLSMLGVV